MHQGRRGIPGFTMIEVVVVVVITGILSVAVSSFIARPFLSYQDSSRRAGLVSSADLVIRRLARDLRAALPNSIRLADGGRALELIHTADGARYRRSPGINGGSGENHSPASDRLNFHGDDEFNLLGRFERLIFSYGVPLAAGHRLAIYTTDDQVYSDAATDASPGLITASTTQISISDDVDEDHLLLSASHRFRLESPQRRLYLVDGPVSYLCDPIAETLSRYDSYAIAAAQPIDPSAVPLAAGSSALVSDRISGCSFSYSPGTPSRAGLVTIALIVSEAGEQVNLLHQVHVGNAP